MWCKGCRQDVPAIRSGDLQPLRCPRCGGAIGVESEQTARSPFATDGLSGYDGWDLDQQLLHIQRTLQGAKGDSSSLRLSESETAASDQRELMRLDPPQSSPAHQHVASKRQGKDRRRMVRRRRSLSSALTWTALSLGAMSLVCGGTLLVWSLATGRQELWNVGLPTALAGQIVLLVGLVLQLDRLWYDSQRAAVKLDDVDQQIHELKSTTMLLGASHGPASATFYSHLAGGATPQLLLTDLKSQLDLLAMRIAQEE